MGAFEYFEHTADVGITAFGSDLKDVFAAAALGLFSLMADLGDLRDKECIEVVVEAEDVESLLVAWLNELLFLFDVEHLLLRSFEISVIGDNGLRAQCWGERFDPERHRLKLGVKAATYHQVRVERIGDGYRAQVVVDV
ncbi:MAG: archease [Chloroflexota bacterium]